MLKLRSNSLLHPHAEKVYSFRTKTNASGGLVDSQFINQVPQWLSPSTKHQEDEWQSSQRPALRN